MENDNKDKQFENKPIVETQVSKSKDGKYVLHTTKIIDIKPIKYWEAVIKKESA